MLEFRVPSGFSVGSVRVYGPSFRKVLGLTPPAQGFAAFVYSSVPLLPADSGPAPAATMTPPSPTDAIPVTLPEGPAGAATAEAPTPSVSWLRQWAAGLDAPAKAVAGSPPHTGRRFLLSQRLCEGARLESLWIHRWSQSWQSVLASVAYPNPSAPAAWVRHQCRRGRALLVPS